MQVLIKSETVGHKERESKLACLCNKVVALGAEITCLDNAK